MKLKWLAIGSFTSSIGMSFIWPLTSVYLHNRLGVSLTIVGIVLLFNSLASVVGSYIGGHMYDRFNPYKLLIASVIVTLAVLLLLIPFHGWPIFGFLLFVNGLTSGWNITMVNAIGSNIKGQDTRYVFNALYFAQNIGIVLGTSLVGFVYGISVTLLFIIASTLYAVFLIIVVTKYKPAANKGSKALIRNNKGIKSNFVPKPNLIILYTFFVSLLIIWVMYQQWVSNLSVYMTTQGIPLSAYSILWTLNAGLIVITQVVINWISRYHENLLFQILFGVLMFAISFFVLIFAKDYYQFVIAMIVLTIGEATAMPTIPAIVNVLTPVEVKGKYQGLINAWASSGRAIGPLFGGLVIDLQSYSALFIIAATFNLIIFIWIAFTWQSVKPRLKTYR
ncbi:MFS transporter [Lentilactobacillus sp. Marseille-Q4993]|uniref:MDR family MFS transporter n=1 Tax=Lentilactobacillus sp. Marseille-Q4993 TaxID=3039492 RepID=UPI0024BC0AD5|nr:MFS transporter [Lentilactobacillus sp. Marseille-Q4993]